MALFSNVRFLTKETLVEKFFLSFNLKMSKFLSSKMWKMHLSMSIKLQFCQNVEYIFFLQGYLINADGNKFNVSFEHNMKNGFGIWTLPDGKGRIEGTWTHGSLEGFVMMFLPDGKKCSNKYLKDKETEEWSCT